MKNNRYTKQEIITALHKAVVDFNGAFLQHRLPHEQAAMNNVILNFVGDVLDNLGIDYKPTSYN